MLLFLEKLWWDIEIVKGIVSLNLVLDIMGLQDNSGVGKYYLS